MSLALQCVFPATPLAIPLKVDADDGTAYHPNAFSQPPLRHVSISTVQTTQSHPKGARCDAIEFIPHCHGTHTEGLGHITCDPIPVNRVIAADLGKFLSATLLTVTPVLLSETSETHPHARAGDYVITHTALTAAFDALHVGTVPDALVIRCAHETFLETPYTQFQQPPYYSTQAMAWITAHCMHHLTNLPSLDPEEDEGALHNHRHFFNVPESRQPSELWLDAACTVINPIYKRTNTELCYIPMHLEDGCYALQLTVLNWALDAAPSVPLLYALKQES